jgi:multiple antibiotic resistance protein
MRSDMGELRLFFDTMMLAVAALLPIVGPVTDVPLYLAMTRGLTAPQRASMAKAVALNSFLLLLGSALFGAYVLDLFGVSVPAVRVGGGILVFALAWSLLNEPDSPDSPSPAAAAAVTAMDAQMLRRRAFYPLTMPLTVGPGSISVAITLGANPTPDVRAHLVTAAAHIAASLIVALTVYVCYRYAEAISGKLGDTGRTVVLRLSAFLLLCIGVQITWNGVRALVASG